MQIKNIFLIFKFLVYIAIIIFFIYKIDPTYFGSIDTISYPNKKSIISKRYVNNNNIVKKKIILDDNTENNIYSSRNLLNDNSNGVKKLF